MDFVLNFKATYKQKKFASMEIDFLLNLKASYKRNKFAIS